MRLPPQGRGTDLRYDVEGDWLLLSTCNYRCDYCFLSENALGAKVQVHASPDQWRKGFDATGRVWLLHLTGGEPSHYPEFVALCKALTQRHYISLNSNLTGPSLARFADEIDPARVSFINAGLHVAERERKQGQSVFLNHAELLMKRGFPIMASVVATPDVLRDFEMIVESLRPIGLVPFPKLMQGKRTGKPYPESYTDDERALFRRHSLAAERADAALFSGRRERPSIDLPMGRDHLEKNPTYLGQMCSAGRDFVKIGSKGDVHRCSGAGKSLGNILRGDLRLKSKAKPCDQAHCFYFCEKFTKRAAERPSWRREPVAAFAAALRRAAVQSRTMVR